MNKNSNSLQIQYNNSGRPTNLVVPLDIIKSFFSKLAQSERETVEIMLDPWWSEVLPQRLQYYFANKKKILKKSTTLEEYKKKINNG